VLVAALGELYQVGEVEFIASLMIVMIEKTKRLVDNPDVCPVEYWKAPDQFIVRFEILGSELILRAWDEAWSSAGGCPATEKERTVSPL
jgi:hypothetical protein